MKNIINSEGSVVIVKGFRLLAYTSLMLLVTACGGVDSSDGKVVNNIELPTDSALTLYCPDAGIAAEPCILEDPDNPYLLTPIHDENKFDLNDGAPSAKSRFYLWATAQAKSPRGENQFYVALSLHEMYGESSSELAKSQALRAYRSILDNYFNEVTFIGPFTGSYIPLSVRKLVADNLSSSSSLASLFADDNEALATYGEWGYTYDHLGSKDFSKNF